MAAHAACGNWLFILDYVPGFVNGSLPLSGHAGLKALLGVYMALDKKDIEKIAWLARLDINPGDVPGYARDLSNILGLVEQLNQVDTANIAPMAHPLDLNARGREDVITETNQREHFQKNAPAVANGHYLVPKVIE